MNFHILGWESKLSSVRKAFLNALKIIRCRLYISNPYENAGQDNSFITKIMCYIVGWGTALSL